MKGNDRFSNIISIVNKNVIRVLIGVMTFTLILGSLHLIYFSLSGNN